MTALMDGHIRLDDRGVAYVGDSRLKLIHFVMTYREEDGSMEGLREAYDWLPAADFHGALAYFFDHQEEVEEAIRAYHERSERLEASAKESSLTERLRENRRARGSTPT